ncbi:flagellar basal body P-ring formation chaperone FlgA [Methylotuvimicrobium buryatense]|uniref:Flagella basal body P-ring formation protein FlgA n=1 Tax=Methylotuvimicrobium buryatense TaxID=95641 RepID=A0A4P9UQM5_METBY|nr:flagellar basal body P-ring formation chaperone FlgA [Methylotuvimicrobium buryatense]QCW83728.1 flagellar basal body P-ring formation protein FlgA [Methylotuvimicrobium buryatense]
MIIKLFVALLVLLAPYQSGFAAPHYQTHASIYQTVTRFITGQLGSSADYDIHISPLDSRLKLPKCADELTAFTAHNEPLRAGRFSVGVRCGEGPKPWSIFTTGSLKIMQDVLVLARPVSRGQILTRQMLTIEKRDQATLRSSYFSQIESVENKQSLRNLPAGSVVTVNNVTDAVLIKRGEKITISASSPGYNVRMQGKAMMDGVKGQSIRVKNVSSGRTITATVIKPGLVSIIQ